MGWLPGVGGGSEVGVVGTDTVVLTVTEEDDWLIDGHCSAGVL